MQTALVRSVMKNPVRLGYLLKNALIIPAK